MPENLRDRTARFARRVVAFCQRIPATREGGRIAAQLVDACTSVGANYRSACRARSKAEFIARIGVVVEGADETVYWLSLIKDSGLADGRDLQDLISEAGELLAIFAASQRTAKRGKKPIRDEVRTNEGKRFRPYFLR